MADVRSSSDARPIVVTPPAEGLAGERFTPTQRLLLLTAAAATACSVAYLIVPKGGTDLSAQVERAHFAADYGLRPIDFAWYGGTNQFGYSLISQYVMAVVGTRVAGALAAILTALAFAVILARTNVWRPRLAAGFGAVCIAANLVSGRITYAIGLAFAVGAIAALTDESPRRRLILAGLGSFLAAATSPVAGLFVGLAGVAMLLSGHRRDGITIGAAAAVPMAVVGVVFGQGGWMNISASDMRHGVGLAVLVLLFAPNRTVRIGAVLSALGIMATYVVHTPVGLNAIRLPVMFATPLLVALVRWRLPVVVVMVGLMWWWQPPVNLGDLHDAGTAAANASYYTPLIHELRTLPGNGRVEVVPSRDYWESTYVAEKRPLARGWMRQLDIERNPLFFNGKLTSNSYQDWLMDNGVRYVAMARASHSWVGSAEVELILANQPYLNEIWHGGNWTLYAVIGSPGIVGAPGHLVSTDPSGLTVRVNRAGPLTVRVHYSRWLTLSGPRGCLQPSGRWTTLRVGAPGTYRISSALQWSESARCG